MSSHFGTAPSNLSSMVGRRTSSSSATASSSKSNKAKMQETLWSTAKQAEKNIPDQTSVQSIGSMGGLNGDEPSVHKSESLRHRNLSVNSSDIQSFQSIERKLNDESLNQLYGREKEILALKKQYDAAFAFRRKGHSAVTEPITEEDEVEEEVDDAPEGEEDPAADSKKKTIKTAKKTKTPPEPQPTRQMTLIGGQAGVGKSVLPAKVLRPLAHHFYLTGKFDYSTDEPYSAIQAAWQILCEELLSHKESPIWDFSYEHFQEQLQKEIDQYALDSLKNIIPGLVEIHSPSAAQSDTATTATPDYTESKISMHTAFFQFLRILSQYGSIVMVLDDLQWADPASRELLKAFAYDQDTPAWMLVGTYRTENEEDIEELRKAFQEGKSAQLQEHRLHNLTSEQVKEMLTQVLALEERQDEAQDLAECLHEKTHGNPFYVRQFLLALEAEELLTFEMTQLRWAFDVQKIRSQSSAADNVVDLLVQKIQKLPSLLHQEILPRLSFLGTRFSLSLADLVIELCCAKEQIEQAMEEYRQASDRETTLDLMSICLSEHILEDTGKGCKWGHDKIQEAARSLVPEENHAAIQLALGEWLLEKLNEKQLKKYLFVVTNLVNAGNSTGLNIAKLNLRAGQAAFQASAFSLAAGFLKRGIKLLPETGKWDPSLHESTLAVYSTAAEAEFCLGNLDQSKVLANEVIENSSSFITVLQKKRAYNVLIFATAAEGKPEEALNLVVSVLKLLKCKFPSFGKDVFTIAGVLNLLASVDKTVDIIDKQGPMTGEDRQWGMFLLDRLATHAYQCKSKLMVLGILKALRWTVKYGTCEMTGPSISTVAMTVAALGDFAGAKKYADVALKHMTTKTKSRTLFVLYALVFHFQTPLELSKKPLMTGYEAGMKSGDIESACWCLICFLEIQYLAANHPLSDVLRDCATYNRQIEKHYSNIMAHYSRHNWQFMINLHDPQANKHIMHGKVVSKEEYLEHFNASKKGGPSTYEQHQLARFRLQAAFWFNEHELVVEIMEFDNYHNFGLDDHFPSCFYNAIVYSYCALSCLSAAHKNRSQESKLKKQAKKFLKKIKEWVKKGNPNCQTHESLIEAELASLDGNAHLAKKNFEVAILLAGRWGHLNDHALSCQRHAEHCLRFGNTEEAAYNLKRALELYREWGAFAIVDMLESQHGDLVNPIQELVISDLRASSKKITANDETNLTMEDGSVHSDVSDLE